MPGFLDSIRQEIDRGIVHIGTRSKQLLETTQIRSQMRLLQSRRDQGIQELGQVLYEMLRKGPFDQPRVEPYITILQQLDAQIAALEEQLENAQKAAQAALRTTRAPAFAYCACGESLKETSRFCPRCGKDVRTIVESAAARGRSAQEVCPSCGAATTPTARFCPSCGQPLTQGG